MAVSRESDEFYTGPDSAGGQDGQVFGKTAASKIGVYGKAPAAQRAYSSAVHATSAQASSTDFGVTQLATLNEILNVLIQYGLIPTS
jgi:hypothetical protein